MELVHRHLCRRLPGILHHRPVPVATAFRQPPDYLARGRFRFAGALAAGYRLDPLAFNLFTYSCSLTCLLPRSNMRVLLSVALTGLAAPALAADLNLKVEVPRLNVAEYHRPYVAIWIERPDQSVAGN